MTKTLGLARRPLPLIVLAQLTVASTALAQSWTFHGTVASGFQIDAVRGPGDVLHLVSSRYTQLDRRGEVLLTEDEGEGQPSVWQQEGVFAPAIAVGDDGTVHVVTRHGGSLDGGASIRYRRRNASGTWDRDYVVGTAVPRNYVVSVAWAGPNQVYLSTSQFVTTISGNLHLWQAGASGATPIGDINGAWRGDVDTRMRGSHGRVFFVSAKPNGGGHEAYFFHADAGPNLVADLIASKDTHVAGPDRTSFPDLYADRVGTAHFSFGIGAPVAGYVNAALYNKYSLTGDQVFAQDQQIIDGLNPWSVGAGLSAVAASDDGETVVLVALRAVDQLYASDCDLLYSYSTDGGATWRPAQDMGHNTNARLGRSRPRLVAVGHQFFMFYNDTASSGISLASLEIEPSPEEMLLDADLFDAPSHSDIDGDGRVDLCARDRNGVKCYPSTGSGVGAAITGPALSNDDGWTEPSYYSTLRIGDMTGDGRADVCARTATAWSCWPSTGTGFGAAIAGPEWSDAAGWNRVEYYSTVRMLDLNADGRMDVCGRFSDGIHCHLSTGTGYGPAIVHPTWRDDSGWASPKYYGTIRVGDVNGDGADELCARAAAGVRCLLLDGDSFELVQGPAWSNADGWGAYKYWSTIRLADLDGDGRADICGRGPAGVRCHLSTGTGFGPEIVGPALSDAAGWGDRANHLTLRMGDLNADGRADLCARADTGIECWLWSDGAFGETITGPELSDANGWFEPKYYRTIRLADVTGDGRTDLCARGVDGVSCWPFDGNGFGAPLAGPALSDANGWHRTYYWSTIRAGGANRIESEVDAGVGGAGVGGTGASAGGTAGGVAAGGGVGGTGPTPTASSDEAGGCGCRVPGSRTSDPTGLLGLLLALGAGVVGRTRLGRTCYSRARVGRRKG